MSLNEPAGLRQPATRDSVPLSVPNKVPLPSEHGTYQTFKGLGSQVKVHLCSAPAMNVLHHWHITRGTQWVSPTMTMGLIHKPSITVGFAEDVIQRLSKE